jgi:hypothetical protein
MAGNYSKGKSIMEPVTTTILTATTAINAFSAMITALTGLLATAVTGFAGVVAACSVIAKYLPPPENGKYNGVYKWVNKLAFNSGHAANKEGIQ